MLSVEDNKLVTDTDPGTPMGELFRRFWLPVALSEELPGPDCAPVRVTALGEDLIAFRDSEGRVGLFDAYCPHRGAPLFFGRNEESGLRCIYHGWKFDYTGQCIDMPNAPEGPSFKLKVKADAYPVVEAGDLIWAYMGPADKKPPFPEFPWTRLPKSHRYVTKFRLECNYLQAMEGDYDPTHARFLHSTFLAPNETQGMAVGTYFRSPSNRGFGSSDPNEEYPKAVGDRRITERNAPYARIEDYDAAVLSISQLNQSNGSYQASVGVTWWMPIFCTAGNAMPGHLSSNMRVPIDNESLMFYRLRWSWDPISEGDLAEYKNGGWTHPEMIPGTWKTKDNVSNDYNLDRLAQRNMSYSGIKTFPLQDIAMMENQWGPIAKRHREHLASSDYQIIHIRRRLLKAAKDLANGVEPSEPWRPEIYRMHRESATGATEQEAIDKARALALTDLLEKHEEVAAPAIRV